MTISHKAVSVNYAIDSILYFLQSVSVSSK